MRLLLSLFALVLISSCGSQDSETQTSANQASAETFKWKLVTSWPKNYPGLGSAPENFAKLVDTMSNGRLQIKVFGAGQLVPALEVLLLRIPNCARSSPDRQNMW